MPPSPPPSRRQSDAHPRPPPRAATPRYPVVLAHGLFGFAELPLARPLPPVQYWRGIKQALAAQGCPLVVTPSVPPSGSIEERAAKLAADIEAALPRRPGGDGGGGAVPVSIIAHSMGGLDARHLISAILPRARLGFRVTSLVTVSTPHRGSPFADYLLSSSATRRLLHLPRFYSLLRAAGLGTAAFAQLTTGYLVDDFNARTPDDAGVRYFSYGAAVDGAQLPLLSPFRLPHGVIDAAEGANDGLVSVASSRWGEYRGTLLGVSHLDLINWPNRLRWAVREQLGMRPTFNAVAFYLDIADMLAREGF